jgi:hypothetical protein
LQLPAVLSGSAFDHHFIGANHPPAGRRDGLRMLNPLFRMLVKVAIASLVVGTIMATSE